MRFDGISVVLTHYINDLTVPFETMELISQDRHTASYRPIDVEEKRFRTDVCGVRMPVAAFQELIVAFQKQIEALAEPTENPAKEEDVNHG